METYSAHWTFGSVGGTWGVIMSFSSSLSLSLSLSLSSSFSSSLPFLPFSLWQIWHLLFLPSFAWLCHLDEAPFFPALDRDETVSRYFSLSRSICALLVWNRKRSFPGRTGYWPVR